MDPASSELHRDALVVDLHTHGTALLPRPVAAAYRAATRGSMPADVGFGELAACAVDAVVAKAVGDPIVTAFHQPKSPWRCVLDQLESLRRQTATGGAVLAHDADEIVTARAAGRPAVVLGVEGADTVRDRPERVEQLHTLGVRVVGLVHYVHNGLGTVCLPWQDWVPLPLPRRAPPVRGLTAAGREAVDAMVAAGIVVDVAHADRETSLAVCERIGGAGRPVISSHAGARGVVDFARFHDDDELRAIAATGGVVGLWPFRYRDQGVADVAEWCRHATYLADLLGVDHLAIGTDMNGVSGLMDGYGGEHDLVTLTDALRTTAGFTDDEVRAVLGGNAVRVLRAAAPSTRRGPDA
jgi:microsomal dipeptidase-like Zn-dependent dipeptidase